VSEGRHTNPPCHTHPASLDRLRDVVMRSMGLTLGDMLSRRRTRDHIRARAIFAGIARRMRPQPSYPEIAHALMHRFHSTVMFCALRYESNPLTHDEEDAIAKAADVRLARHPVTVTRPHPQISGAMAERFLAEVAG